MPGGFFIYKLIHKLYFAGKVIFTSCKGIFTGVYMFYEKLQSYYQTKLGIDDYENWQFDYLITCRKKANKLNVDFNYFIEIYSEELIKELSKVETFSI